MRGLFVAAAIAALVEAAGCCCECMESSVGGEELGPTIALSPDHRSAQYRVHVCVEGADPRDADAWYEITAAPDPSSSDVRMQLATFALTEADPVPFEDTVVPGNLGLGVTTEAPWCSEGISIRFERTDDSTRGTTLVDWRISLGADPPGDKEVYAVSFQFVEE